MDIGSMWELLRQARWDGIVLLVNAFFTAAGTHWWMWVVLVLVVVTAGSKALIRLARYIGLSFLRPGD